MIPSAPHPQTGQPIGLSVDTTPAKRPGPVTLQGRYGRIEKLEPRHAADLIRQRPFVLYHQGAHRG